MGWTMGLMDYGKAAGSAADVIMKLKEMKQKKELEEKRLAQQAAQQQMMGQYYQGLVQDREASRGMEAKRFEAEQAVRDAAAREKAEAGERTASYDMERMNLPLTMNMRGLMDMGAVEDKSSDPRALAMAARGELPGMKQPGGMDYARVAAKYGDIKPLVELQKSDEINQSRKEIQDSKNAAYLEALAQKMENAIKTLELKNDYASKLQAEKLTNALERIREQGAIKGAQDREKRATAPTKNIAVYIDKVNGARHVINLDNPKHREWLSTYGNQLVSEREQTKLNEIKEKNPYGSLPKRTAGTSSSKYKILRVD